MRRFLAVAKALADESRVRILMLLRGGELCVCQVIELLGLAPSTVSKHMSVLYQAGLVDARKEGRWVYYRLADADAPALVRQALEWVVRSLADDPHIQEDARRGVEVRRMDRKMLCLRYRGVGGGGSRLRVLFLCSGNACRSQMAEGWARRLRGEVLEPHSAGIAPAGLEPRAVRVMAEVGVDISRQRSKHVGELADMEFDYVVTLCDRAREACPVFPGRTRVVHVGFDDPAFLAAEAHSEEEALDQYRRVRDEIRAFVEGLPEALVELRRGRSERR